MKAILIGTIADGFGITAVVSDDQAEEIVIRHLANGTLAEAMEICPPSDLDNTIGPMNGSDYVVFNSGLGNGCTIYGPFDDDEVANTFGEEYRGEDEEWELFTH